MELVRRHSQQCRLSRLPTTSGSLVFPHSGDRVGGADVAKLHARSDVPRDAAVSPHGLSPRKRPRWSEYVDHSDAANCPSSPSPHRVRTESITRRLNRGVPIEIVAERVNTSVRALKRCDDQPTQREGSEERRREYVERLGFGESGGDEWCSIHTSPAPLADTSHRRASRMGFGLSGAEPTLRSPRPPQTARGAPARSGGLRRAVAAKPIARSPTCFYPSGVAGTPRRCHASSTSRSWRGSAPTCST
jgi:hypothetical protein